MIEKTRACLRWVREQRYIDLSRAADAAAALLHRYLVHYPHRGGFKKQSGTLRPGALAGSWTLSRSSFVPYRSELANPATVGAIGTVVFGPRIQYPILLPDNSMA